MSGDNAVNTRVGAVIDATNPAKQKAKYEVELLIDLIRITNSVVRESLITRVKSMISDFSLGAGYSQRLAEVIRVAEGNKPHPQILFSFYDEEERKKKEEEARKMLFFTVDTLSKKYQTAIDTNDFSNLTVDELKRDYELLSEITKKCDQVFPMAKMHSDTTHIEEKFDAKRVRYNEKRQKAETLKGHLFTALHEKLFENAAEEINDIVDPSQIHDLTNVQMPENLEASTKQDNQAQELSQKTSEDKAVKEPQSQNIPAQTTILNFMQNLPASPRMNDLAHSIKQTLDKTQAPRAATAITVANDEPAGKMPEISLKNLERICARETRAMDKEIASSLVH